MDNFAFHFAQNILPNEILNSTRERNRFKIIWHLFTNKQKMFYITKEAVFLLFSKWQNICDRSLRGKIFCFGRAKLGERTKKFCAQYSDFKLATSTFVLSILEFIFITTFDKHFTFTITYVRFGKLSLFATIRDKRVETF